MLGIYHPFLWNTRETDVDNLTIYKIKQLDVILTGQIGSVTLVNAVSGAVTSPTINSVTWTVKGVTVQATRVSASLSEGVLYYLNVDGLYFSDLITKSTCTTEILTWNSCSNQFYDWDSDPVTQKISLFDPVDVAPIIETESETVITEYGQQDKTLRVNKKYRIQFVAPVGYIQILSGLKINDSVTIDSQEIINIEVEAQEQEGGRYSIFTLSYQLKNEFQEGSTCCDIINIDDIISPDNGGGGEECEGFTVEIDYTDGELSAVTTGEPEGTPIYKWYRNGIYLSGASSIVTDLYGDYKVEVRIGACTAKANYYIVDECTAFQLELTKTLNSINGTVSNVPDGTTESYSVVLNGVEVATSLPYTALEDGIYYVYATAGECNKVKGISVTLEDNDCDFTIDIIENGGILEADTDATTPTYEWAFETSAGRNVIGTAATQVIDGKGIYWLNITQGDCTKETYLYLEPLTESGIFVRYGGTGTTFTVLGINLLDITNYAGTIKVTVNGVVFSYTAGAPGLNQYSVNITGQLLFANTLTNPTIIVELI
ncbi:MAG: hypothetical protein IPO37_13390 [Saprospiraceae bacterium]|nr:hypothetical protein [Saprospiraceae bacterium]